VIPESLQLNFSIHRRAKNFNVEAIFLVGDEVHRPAGALPAGIDGRKLDGIATHEERSLKATNARQYGPFVRPLIKPRRRPAVVAVESGACATRQLALVCPQIAFVRLDLSPDHLPVVARDGTPVAAADDYPIAPGRITSRFNGLPDIQPESNHHRRDKDS
jgi:hypothetical protein